MSAIETSLLTAVSLTTLGALLAYVGQSLLVRRRERQRRNSIRRLLINEIQAGVEELDRADGYVSSLRDWREGTTPYQPLADLLGFPHSSPASVPTTLRTSIPTDIGTLTPDEVEQVFTYYSKVDKAQLMFAVDIEELDNPGITTLHGTIRLASDDGEDAVTLLESNREPGLWQRVLFPFSSSSQIAEN